MNYTCPYCGHHSTVVGLDASDSWRFINMHETEEGSIGFGVQTIRCVNVDCNKLFLRVRLTEAGTNYNGTRVEAGNIKEWQLLPESSAKALPDYVPTAIQEDYYEACRIRDLSPKASATLSRRCLQGMIRDFHGIVKARLIDEIRELEGKIDQDVWESIEAVRAVGNIGAHMEKDINVIIDVEPEEAQLLISLIEQLVDDWYVAREARKKRAEGLKNMAAAKKDTPK